MTHSMLFNLIVFLSAFLLFQLELIVAKMLLPYYGGSYLVWGSSVVFFQAVLLGGYLYAHWVVQKFGILRYRIAHLLVCLVPLCVFPGRPLSIHAGGFGLPLAIDVFLQLTVTIGPVFFVLSTMSLLMQAWFSRSNLPHASNPYPLYAVSNLGSFAALISYPFLFEAQLDLNRQLDIWRNSYLAIVLLQGLLLLLVKIKEEKIAGAPRVFSGTTGELKVVPCFLFGAAGVVLFLSVTNIMTTEIAPMPLLWVIPLAIYLLAFVFNFKRTPFYPAWMTRRISWVLGFSALLYFFVLQKTFPDLILFVLFACSLFALCMFCQRQLYLQRPLDEGALSFFYVVVATGGFCGGILVSWVMPLISVSPVEFLTGVAVVSIGMAVTEEYRRPKIVYVRFLLYTAAILIFWPTVFPDYNIVGIVFLIVLWGALYQEFGKNRPLLSWSLILIFMISGQIEYFWTQQPYVFRHRNYYGISKIFDFDSIRHFQHGMTLHGAQALIPGREPEPLTYFSVKSPVGEVLISPDIQFERLGIIGLGIGTLSAYLKPGQRLDFFELDPDVYDMAQKYFTFLSQAAGEIRYLFGDARLSLDKIPDNYYDVFVVDAFSGDAIPIHLITQEAVLNMRRHLKDKGIILFHISNRYLQLEPVLAKIAEKTSAYAAFKYGDSSSLYLASQWGAMTWDEESYRFLGALKWKKMFPHGYIHVRTWTDTYSNVLSVLKFQEMFSAIRNFEPLRYYNFLKR